MFEPWEARMKGLGRMLWDALDVLSKLVPADDASRAASTTPAERSPSVHPALQVHLAEYTSLRTEVLNRMATQSQAFNYLLIVIGAAATALVTSLDQTRIRYFPEVVLIVSIVLPLIAAPLGFLFFDNEMAVHAIGSYLAETWVPRTRPMVQDAEILGNIWAFVGLPPHSSRLHRRLSQGRWVLFALPTVMPVIALADFAFGGTARLVAAHAPAPGLARWLPVLVWAALVLNTWILVLLFRGIVWAWKSPR
jgi:hypothetical protein